MHPSHKANFCRACLIKIEPDDQHLESQQEKYIELSKYPNLEQLIQLCLLGNRTLAQTDINSSCADIDADGYILPYMCRICFVKWLDFEQHYQLLLRNNAKLKKLLSNDVACGTSDSNGEPNKIFIKTSATAELYEIEKYETSSPFYQDCSSNQESIQNTEDFVGDNSRLDNNSLLTLLPDPVLDESSSFAAEDKDDKKTTKNKPHRGRSKASQIKRKYTRRNANKKSRQDTLKAASSKISINKKALYRCDPCKKYFYEINRYEGHIKLVHEGIKKAFQCNHCGKAYKFYKNLTEHISDNHSDKPQKPRFCELCNKEFKTSTTLKNHMKIKHPDDGDSSINSRRVMCEQCGFLAASPESLAAHIKNIHTEAEQFKCDMCPKVFKCRYYLKHHTMIHHSEVKIKPFKCTECDMAFTRRNGLTKHKLTHINYTERIKCDFEGCDVRFLNTDAKKRHTRLVHLKVKQHICDICGEAFGIKATLRHHRYIHTGEKPYKCNVCGQGFRQHTAMKTHAKTHISKTLKVSSKQQEQLSSNSSTSTSKNLADFENSLNTF
uniref:C2H2-type domain-containing protein n=1 Tax=Stomoxys calcitrans TaxID=35570 RepID=A0A1I8QDP0_STOCA